MSRASQMVKTGDGLELVPRQFGKYLGGSPCTAYRFLSLAGPEVITKVLVNQAHNRETTTFFPLT